MMLFARRTPRVYPPAALTLALLLSPHSRASVLMPQGTSNDVKADQANETGSAAPAVNMRTMAGDNRCAGSRLRIEARALKGDTGAQVCLGMFALAEKDFVVARYFFARAAEKNNGDGEYQLGLLHESGRGGATDLATALLLYRRAAADGSAAAELRYAKALEAGEGQLGQHPGEAARRYRRAAEAKDDQIAAEAKFRLASLIEQGTGVKADSNEAWDLYKRAAEKGSEDAKTKIKVLTSGDARADDVARLSNTKGPIARTSLGLIYERGLGGEAANSATAALLYAEAAKTNFALAQLRLGSMYERGTTTGTDTKKYAREAADLYKKAAANGLGEAAYRYASMLDSGVLGKVKHDEAERWFTDAKSLGYDPSNPASASSVASSGDLQNTIKTAPASGLPEIAALDSSLDIGDMLAAAAKHDAAALEKQGRAEYFGVGPIAKNVPDAVLKFQDAANRSDTLAAYDLGVLYERGDLSVNGAPDTVKALKWYGQAAAAGSNSAQNRITQIAQDSKVAPEVGALAKLMSEALAGKSQSEFDLGSMYLEGRGELGQNIEAAITWLNRAASHGYVKANAKLGRAYTVSDPPDYPKAAQWCSTAAKNGSDEGTLCLADLYVAGQGVAADRVEAIKLYATLARQEQPFAPAFDRLSVLAGNNDANVAALAKLVLTATKEDDVSAQLTLGERYLKGTDGVTADNGEAAIWLLKAAQRQNSEAELLVGDLYHEGRGIVQDPQKAAEYWSRALQHGNGEAATRLSSNKTAAPALPANQ